MIRVVIRGRKCSDEPSYVRIGGRAIIKKDGSYLFSYLTARNEYLFPGGGVEEGESITDGTEREVEEECGLRVSVQEPFLVIDEYYFDKNWRNSYSIAEVTGAVEAHHDRKEDELGLVPVWVPECDLPSVFSASMNADDIPDAPESTLYAVYASHYRESIAYALSKGFQLPALPPQLASMIASVEVSVL